MGPHSWAGQQKLSVLLEDERWQEVVDVWECKEGIWEKLGEEISVNNQNASYELKKFIKY